MVTLHNYIARAILPLFCDSKTPNRSNENWMIVKLHKHSPFKKRFYGKMISILYIMEAKMLQIFTFPELDKIFNYFVFAITLNLSNEIYILL